MKPSSHERMTDILKALSHPVRIRILEIVAEEKHCQCELAGLLNEHTVNISRHLTLLVRVDLVYLERRGTKTFPHLRYPEIMELLDNLRTILDNQARDQIELVASTATRRRP